MATPVSSSPVVPVNLDNAARLIRALRKINQFVQALEHSSDVNALCREAVLFTRRELEVERCGLYLVENEGLRGTWGTDIHLQLISESAFLLPEEELDEIWHEVAEPNRPKWDMRTEALRDWNHGEPIEVAQGWRARTAIHSNGRLIGVFFNDTAVSGNPPDEIVQEALVVFGGLLGQMIEVQRAREESSKREAEYRLLVEHLPDIVKRYDREGRHLYVSPQIAAATGYPPEAIVGKRWRDLPMPQELIDVWEKKLEEVFTSAQPRLFEFDLPTPIGNRRILARLIPEADVPGTEPKTVLGVLSDVTDKREAEDALIENERRYRRAIIQAGLIPYERNLNDDAYSYIGDEIEELVGLPPSEMSLSVLRGMVIETKLRGRIADMPLPDAVREVRAGRIKEWTSDVRIRNRRGEEVWFADCALMTYDERTNQFWILGFLQDITERMRIEADLISSQRRLSLLNRVARSIHGNLTLHEVLGHVLTEIHSYLPQYRISYTRLSRDGKLEVLCSRQQPGITATEGMSFDCRNILTELRNAFDLVPSIVTDIQTIELSEEFQQLCETTKSRAWLTVPMNHDEKSVGILTLSTANPHSWQESELQTMLEIADYLKLVIRDSLLRQRREASEKALQESREMLLQSQKMDAIARLAGGIAHDFNNLLTVIAGNIELIAEDFSESDRKIEGIDDIRNAVSRASALTSQLLNYGRRQFVQPVVFRLVDRSETLDKLLRRSIPEDIEYLVDLGGDVRPIRADPGQIEQMIMNMVINSTEAMPEGGCITVTATNHVVAGDEAKLWSGMRPGEYVLITVADNGVGIAADDIPRLFEPFYSTKASPAAGLGLASVFGIVKKFEGDVRVESTKGEGAKFSIIFPACAPQEIAVEKPKEAGNPRGDETVLLVEDEASLLAMAARTLRSFGYRVLEAQSGAEALKVFDAMGRDVDILVTDVVMPGMSGPELARQLTEKREDLPVLYVSGYSDEEIVRRGIERGSMNFLGKPFNPRALGERIRKILDATNQKV